MQRPARARPVPPARSPRPRAGAAALGVGLAAALLGISTAGEARAAVGVTDLRTWSAPERTRIVLDLDGESTYKVWRRATAPHLVMEVKGARNRTGRVDWPKVDDRVRGVEVTQTGDGMRVAVTLSEPLQYKHFALAPYGPHKPHRIVLDVYGKPATVQPAPAPAPGAAAAGRPFVVVVDAGHGGEDPGAVGRYYRTQEKDVVLRVARLLKAEIDQMPGMRAELTRRGDYFVTLGGRIRKADALHGDLFVSIHADSSHDRRTRGTHVYTLAPRSARDRQAVRVARMENASDFVGGVEAAARLPMIFDEDGSPNNTVESRVLARMALGRLREVNSAGRDGRRSEARFWVLKGNRPSLLVETAFLSNREDERMLRTGDFQQALARDIALAIRDYVETRVKGGSIVHTVRSGETLSHIARRYGLEVGDLAEANGIGRSDLIRVGDRLMVPRQGWPGYRAPAPPKAHARTAAYTPEQAPTPSLLDAVGPEAALADEAPASTRHTVRAGENLTRIAQDHGVRLGDLMRANHLSPGASLLAGRTLLVPAPRPTDLAYTVRPGDSLSGLAQRHRVALSELARVNDLTERARLGVGQRLILPGVAPAPRPPSTAPVAHRVARGETLSGLALRYRVSQAVLARANGLAPDARLLVGQRLVVPVAGGTVVPRDHRVARGETLSGLAVRYGLSQTALARANGLRPDARLLVGQVLRLPAGGGGGPEVHVIRPGDSLTRIAQRYDVSPEALASANALRDADLLMVGARLTIPR